MSRSFTEIGTAIGELVERKNAAYGSSFAKAGDFLRLLWPDGVPAERYDDALLMVRIFDKQMRIATNKDAFGESPYGDIAGYGILGVELHERKQEQCGGTASGPAASELSKDSSEDSALANVSRPIRTSGSEPSEPRSEITSKPKPESSLPGSASPDVSAPYATEAVSVRNAEADHAKTRNEAGFCGARQCVQPLMDGSDLEYRWELDGYRLRFHQYACLKAFERNRLLAR